MKRHILIKNGNHVIFNCDVEDLELYIYDDTTGVEFKYEGMKLSIEIPKDYTMEIKGCE